MKHNLLTFINEVFKKLRYPLVGVLMFFSAQLSAQLCAPQLDGSASVCPGSVEVYTAIRGEAGSTLSWSLSGGGVILSVDNNDTEASVEWDGTSGGPFTISVTESTLDCSETFELEVVIESEYISLACNDLVHVALDQNCQAEITADMILEDPTYGDDSYTVHLSDQNYNPISGNIVDIQYLNEIINVTIEHNCTGLSCRSQITVQDNIAPGLVCRPDLVEIDCNQPYIPENVGFPLPLNATIVKILNNEYSVEVPGECGGAYTLVYSDDVENLDCGANYDFIVTRTWIATDESGNSTQCEETLGAVWGDLNTMTLPPHYDGYTLIMNHNEVFQCSYANQKNYWPHDYNPGPDVTGYPEWSGCSNIQYYYEDLVFKICGNSRKIVRHWFILDWCTGQDYTYDQLIIIEDNAPPVVSEQRDTIYFPTLAGKCYGTAYPIPDPNVLFDCSDWTYTISYKLKDETGNPYEYPITDNVFEGPQGFGIRELPVDTTWVIYDITDECGNKATAFIEVIIEDRESPTAVCDKHTIVTLTLDGTAKIFAESIDDGSNDNCEVDRFEIRRMDTPCAYPEDLLFGDVVNFCCADVDKTILVVFRVYDIRGYYSDCMVEVTVNDKMAPEIIECPPDVYLDCGDDYHNLALTGGRPIVVDNCDTYTIDSTDYVNLSDCGMGYIRRDWKVTDGSGLTDFCRQYIYIEDQHPLSADDIDWPADYEFDGCELNDFDPDITGFPVLNNTNCKDLGVAYTDHFVHDLEGLCLKVLREWKVGNWCETPPYTYITYTQEIEVLESLDPYFTSCQDITVESDNNNCDALITVETQAGDDCTPVDQLKYNWEIDFDKDGVIDDSGLGKSFTRTFPHGQHWVNFYVSDGCGNYDNCRLTVRVKDTKDPTPICIAKLTTTIMDIGEIEVWAGMFNLCQCSSASFDNCTPSDQLRFSYSSDVNDTHRVFTCDDIPNGVAVSIPLEMWVTDLDGNQDFCNVTLIIMDNVLACPDAPDASASLSGFIVDENESGMPDFEVELEKDESEILQKVTDSEGKYVFENLDVYSKYKLQPKKDIDPSNGVSTLDLVMIQKHILGLRELDSPYKLIAADANSTGSVTAGDLLEIRSLILGISEDYNKNDSWRFIDGSFEFDNPQAPWDFDESFIVDELYFDSDSINFIGIKIGDVNNSATAELTGQVVEPRSNESLVLRTEDIQFEAGEKLIVDLELTDDLLLEGMQFSISYDPAKLQVLNLTSSTIALSKANTHFFDRQSGIVTFSWNASIARELVGGSDLFQLEILAHEKGLLSDNLKINSAYTKAEAYDESLNKMDIELRFDENGIERFMVYQNSPNPFEDETSIKFYLPKDDELNTTVFDNNGKVIHEAKGHYSKGTHTIVFTKDIFNYHGVYFYQLTTSNNSIVKKMIYTR